MKNLISILATSAITTVALLAINKYTGVLRGPRGADGISRVHMMTPEIHAEHDRELVSNEPTSDRWKMSQEDEDFVKNHKEHLEKIGFWRE